jgi:tetratricopeptide (TPR) repeat protein
MLIANPEDSQRCFQVYLEDAQRRLKMNPPQLKPGEDVRLVGDGPDQRVQVSGQVAVMSINGLLTKVMFDKNPENEFFVEESFPLEWMYDYLTPFGVIMKINRHPLPELTEDILRRDHEFWAKYSDRLIGNWITYDTPVKDIVKFTEKLYLKRDLSEFKGDLKFARDDQAQKAFSKLRSSIGGVFAWRVSQATGNVISLQDQLRRSPAQGQAALQAQLAHWSAVRDRMIKETDFAFRQAFAFCPYSPEAVFRYCQLLISLNRIEDAYLIAETCRKLDPYNAQVVDLVNRLSSAKTSGATGAFPPQASSLTQLEAEVASNPADFQKVFNLAASHLGMNQTNRALELLDSVLNHPKVDPQAILALAQAYISVGNYSRLEATLEKLVKLAPTQPEAWYDLSALKAQLQKPAEVLPNLRQALALSAARLKADPKQKDLRAEASNDWRFDVVRQNAEFRALMTAP